MKLVLVLIIGLIVGGGGGVYFGSKYFTPNEGNNKRSEIRISGLKYTNPLLECEGEDSLMTNALIPFKNVLEKQVKKSVDSGQASHISVYFRDLKNGPWIGINQEELFSPASLLKVPIMMAYYKMAEDDVSLLEKEYSYDDLELSEDETYTLTLKKGNKYKVGDLINRMVIFSDNAAAHILYNNLDPRKFAEPYSFLELEVPFTRLGEYSLSVRKYAGFFRLLFNASFMSPDASERALALMTKVQFPLGIRAGIPKEIEVADKYGERSINEGNENQLHDCGIVYYPNYPYLLCIMTRGNDIQKLPEVVAGISKVVYTEVDRQRKGVN